VNGPADPAREPGTGQPSAVRDITRILLVVLVIALLAFIVRSEPVRAYFDITAWREVLQQGRFVGGAGSAALLFVLGGGLAVSLGVPRIWVAALFGAVYGAVFGSVLAIASALLGTSVVYLAGRHYLRDVVERRVGERLDTWRRRFRENAFWWVLYARLFPLANSSVTSLACGACEVPFASYLLGSFVGFIPYTLVFAIFGSGGAKANTWQIALGLGLMLMVFALRTVVRRASRSARGRVSEADEPTR
jgi:uncharacterized membrane protein YdjX (TVP38/TMEM64 family)